MKPVEIHEQLLTLISKTPKAHFVAHHNDGIFTHDYIPVNITVNDESIEGVTADALNIWVMDGWGDWVCLNPKSETDCLIAAALLKQVQERSAVLVQGTEFNNVLMAATL